MPKIIISTALKTALQAASLPVCIGYFYHSNIPLFLQLLHLLWTLKICKLQACKGYYYCHSPFFVLFNSDAWRLLLSLFIFHYFSSTWSLQAASLQRLLLLLLCKLAACRDFHHGTGTTFIYLKYLSSIEMVAEVIIQVVTFAFVNTWALQAAGMHWSLL